VAIRFKPGKFTKTTDPPEARDLTEQEIKETGASLGPDEELERDEEPKKEGDEKKEEKKEKSKKKDEAGKGAGR
jgi:hypothetical protein